MSRRRPAVAAAPGLRGTGRLRQAHRNGLPRCVSRGRHRRHARGMWAARVRKWRYQSWPHTPQDPGRWRPPGRHGEGPSQTGPCSARRGCGGDRRGLGRCGRHTADRGLHERDHRLQGRRPGRRDGDRHRGPSDRNGHHRCRRGRTCRVANAAAGRIAAGRCIAKLPCPVRGAAVAVSLPRRGPAAVRPAQPPAGRARRSGCSGRGTPARITERTAAP